MVPPTKSIFQTEHDAIAAQKAILASAPKFNAPAHKDQHFKYEHTTKNAETLVVPKSWNSYIYEHMTPTNIALATIGALGASAAGYSYRNEIYNVITGHNNNRLTLISPLKEYRDAITTEYLHPQKLFDDNLAITFTDQVITFLQKNGAIQTLDEKDRFKQDFSALIKESDIGYDDLINNFNKDTTITDRAVFEDIFLDRSIAEHTKINNLNIKPGLIHKVLTHLTGRSNLDKTAMFNFLNGQNYKYLVYLMYKMVHGQKIDELDQASVADKKIIDTDLSDYEIAANEEMNQAETSPNIEAYSKQALLLDPQESPSWEMLKDQMTCSNTLVIKAKEENTTDDESCPAMDIAPLSLAQKSILAYEPGTCDITMKSLQTLSYTSGLQSLVSYFINSGANPYIASANQLVFLPLSQLILIDKLCDSVDAFFTNQAYSIQEDILYKNLLEEALSNMPSLETAEEILIAENYFSSQQDNYPNTTTTNYNAYNQTDDSSLATESSIFLGFTSKLIPDYHSA